jgi:hypothetical protein
MVCAGGEPDAGCSKTSTPTIRAACSNAPAGTRPRTDHTIETALATVRDLAIFLATSAGTLSEIVRGQMGVAHAINHRLARAKGSPEAIRRMFASIGFPLVQVGM